MTCTCTHSDHKVDTKVSVYARADRYDPTRTTSLREAWVREFNKRFRRLRGLINKAIIDQDCFGMMSTYILPAHRAFDFPQTSSKVAGFMKWLDQQVQAEMLQVVDLSQVGQSVNGAWTNKYVYDSYKRGVIRARYELEKNGFPVPKLEESGGIEASMSTPFHMDRVGALYTRVFTQLKGITDTMDQQISQILGQGLIDGDHPRLLARKLNATISGTGRETLGITDSLGRAISPERRARMLARTEVIRAHHQAMITEYENWKVEGVEVMAEWLSAGYNVCPECQDLETGGPYTLEEIRNMIPAHPNCFLDPQTPIYTSTGWKAIGKIEVGDHVLTHKRRFRKVTTLIRQQKQSPDAVKFILTGGMKIAMTANHPVLVTLPGMSISRWIEAKDVQKDHQLIILATQCQRCGELIPYYRKYCSLSCRSKDITDKQWSNPEHRQIVSQKASLQLKKEYANGTRNKQEITKAANKKVRLLAKQGKCIFQQEHIREKIRQVTNTVEMRKASSDRMKKNNPMTDPAICKKATISLIQYLEEHPEKRLNARMAKHRKSGKKTWIEQRMADLLDRLGIDYVFQYPILRYDVDFAIPALRIVIECDGEQWHKDKEKDQIRQRKIEQQGWFVLRYDGAKINQCIDEIRDELSRVISNHTDEYRIVGINIQSIEKWKVKKPRMLYNFSVEEDESYLAKGIVVHNCRCTTIPIKKEDVK